MEQLLHKFQMVDFSRQFPNFFAVTEDLLVLGLLQPPGCNKGTNTFQFSGIEPPSAISATIDHNTRDALEIDPIHPTAAFGTGEVSFIARRRHADELRSYGFIPINIPFGSKERKVLIVYPKAGTLRALVKMESAIIEILQSAAATRAGDGTLSGISDDLTAAHRANANQALCPVAAMGAGYGGFTHS